MKKEVILLIILISLVSMTFVSSQEQAINLNPETTSIDEPLQTQKTSNFIIAALITLGIFLLLLIISFLRGS